MRRHTGELFQCDICGLQYNCKYVLQKHKECKHGIEKDMDGLNSQDA